MSDDSLRDTYNRIAKDYVVDHGKDTWDNDYIKYLAEALSKNSKVLDLGCGPGFDTAKLLKKGLIVEGFDLSDDLLEIARRLNTKTTFTQGDMRKLPYDNDSFDGVFAKASLLHIPKRDISKVLSEISRVLKPNGYVHIAVKGGEGEGTLIEDDYGYEYRRFFSYWKMEDFIKELEEQKFYLVRSEIWRKTELSYTIWVKILAKKTS